jgi:voltage-gated potassium channel
MAGLAQRDRLLGWRRRLYEIIEAGRGDDSVSRLFDGFIITLIVASILAFALGTVPEIEATWGTWLAAFEVVTVAIFTLEYALRLWTAVEVPYLRRLSPWRARLRFASTPYLLIDLIAILPFYLGALVGMDLRVLRVLRLMRFLKLSRYSPALHTILRVLSNERRSLLGAGFLLSAVLLLCSTGMYYIEGHVQPEKLGTLPLAAYWAMTTLTTVGYGDVAPVTELGRVWAMLTMLIGLCTLALPVAIIASGFAQEVGRRDFVVTWTLVSRIPMLATLDGRAVSTLLPMLHALNVPPHTEVISHGSRAEAVYFVAAGSVRHRHAEGERTFGTGDCIGLAALIEGAPHAGSYVTLGKCRLLKLFRSDLARLEASLPGLAERLRDAAREQRDGWLDGDRAA